MNFFSSSFLRMELIGNDIQRLVVGILLFLPFLSLITLAIDLEAILSILVPKNLARCDLVLVMKVLSSESSSLIVLRKVFSLSFSCIVKALLPHTPITQSSAYLTYFSFTDLGFGMSDFSFLSFFRF